MMLVHQGAAVEPAADWYDPGANKGVFWEYWVKDSAGLYWPIGLCAIRVRDGGDVGGLFVARACRIRKSESGHETG